MGIGRLSWALLVSSFCCVAESNCWQEAGARYSVDPWLLYAIAQQESGLNPQAVHRNTNGTTDMGLMQINSNWLPSLKAYGITEQKLYEPCINIHVGAWVLAQSIQYFGNNWRAVGAYNAGTGNAEKNESLRQRYAADVHRRYRAFSERMRR